MHIVTPKETVTLEMLSGKGLDIMMFGNTITPKERYIHDNTQRTVHRRCSQKGGDLQN